jgi:CHAD domain-containing protein
MNHTTATTDSESPETGTPDVPRTLGDLVSGYAAEQCTVIIDAEGPIRAGENVVHVTRVGVRRLRSTIRVFAELYDVPRAGNLEDELVWWAGLLGAVRDQDILQAGLSERIAELPSELVMGPVESTIQTEIAASRKVAADAVGEALDSDRYRKLVALLHEWRSAPPMTDEAKVDPAEVTGYVKRAGKKAQKRLVKAVAARNAGEEADELFHSARKAAKRHRYAVEAAAPVWGSKAEKIVQRRKDLQDVLGGHQDRIVQRAFLRDLGARLGVRSGQNGFTYGVLYSQVVADGSTLTKDLKKFL